MLTYPHRFQAPGARLILTNDDGIDAPGLGALAEACTGLGEVVTVAPDRCHSSMSHCVTTERPISVSESGPGRWRVEGSPADCARIAITCIAPQAEWLVAGINRGGNLGADVFVSGTVAAAREAALLGKTAVAISQYIAKGRTVDWRVTARRARQALKRIMARPLEDRRGVFWNVNLPSLDSDAEAELVFCPADTLPLDVQFQVNGSEFRYSGSYQARPRTPGADVELCFAGNITVSLLTVAH